MNLLRWAVLPAALVSLALSSCAGQTTKAAITPPSPVVAESPSPVANTFDAGVAKASDASYAATNAETSEDWDLAVDRWQQAIELMQGVPTGSVNYAQARAKLSQYQRNLVAAQGRTTPKEVASEPETTELTANTNASSVDDSVSSLSKDQRDQLFLAVLDSNATTEERAWAETVRDGNKIALAHTACRYFGRGASLEDLLWATKPNVGFDKVAMRYMERLYGIGVGAYCREHKDKLPS